jgi:hypothetical protein
MTIDDRQRILRALETASTEPLAQLRAELLHEHVACARRARLAKRFSGLVSRAFRAHARPLVRDPLSERGLRDERRHAAASSGDR